MAVLVTNPIHGTLTFNPDGSFTYTNDGTGASSDFFSYQASNGNARSNIAIITITIGAADTVVANPETYSVSHAASITVGAPGVLANDTDPNGAPLIAQTAVPPTHGLLSMNANGSFTYAHDGSNTTSDTFAYRATDGVLTSAAAIVNLNVGLDIAPTAGSQRYTTAQNTALSVPAPGVLTGATDPDSGALTAVLQSGPAHGTIALNPDGSFVYTPALGYSGSDSFSWRANDGIFTSFEPGTASITVTPQVAPIAFDDRYVATSSTLTINAPGVLTNDTLNGAVVRSFGANGIDQNGIGFPAVTKNNGQITLNADGSFTYTAPNPAFTGEDGFKYVIANSSGSSMATVTLTVVSLNTGCATIAINPAALPAGSVGAVYPAVSFSQTGGMAPVTWSSGSLPPGLAFSEAGVLSGTPTMLGSFNVIVIVTDANTCSAIRTLTLNVGCAMTVGAASLAPGTAGAAYAPVTLSTTGGAAPIAWSVTSGALPAGMSLSSTGTLSGTPAQTGSFPFVVTATDANGCTAVRPLTLLVNSRCPAMTITPTALPGGAAGVIYPAVSFSQSGGAAPVTWSSGALPPGMTLSSAGVFSGTPTGIGVFNVSVTATDANGCSATLSLPLGVNITCPAIVIGSTNLAAATEGVAYPSAALTQTGGIAPIVWSISAGLPPAGLTLSSAGVLSGTPTQLGSFLFTVKAVDANGCFATRDVALSVNAKCPTISIAPTSLPGGSAGSLYPAQSFSQTGGAAPVTWSAGALPPGMSFSPAGVLTGTPTSIGVFNVTVTVTDANACSATLSVPLGVNITCPTINITTASLPAAIAGSVYAPVALSALGGVAPLTWNLSAGALPTGLTLSTQGILSGTPAQTGSFDFTVIATDANGCFDTQDLSLAVNARCPTISISPSTLPTGALGVAYTAVSLSQSGGAAPVTWTSGALPPGLTLSNAGVVSGTPTAAGTFNITVTATDANDCASSGVVSLTITRTCAVAVTAAILSSGTQGVAYPTLTLMATGGVSPYNWSVVFGTLPPGLVLSPQGVLSGTPSQSGTFSFLIQATDANSCSATRTLSLTVNAKCPPITITPASLPSASLGVAYPAASFTQSGATAPVTWSSGVLPPGMSFSTAGVLSGTPAAPGTYNIAVTATDANACIASAVVPLVISSSCPPIAITAPALAAGTVGRAYPNVTFQSSGGVAPITWSLILGALPSGMTFSPQGVLSGTPAQSGTFAFSVLATDANSCTSATQNATLTVNAACGTIAIAPPTLNAAVNVAFAASLSQTGGTAPVSWTASGLPPGMALSTTGVLSGTPTSTGTYNTSVTVTDANNCTGSGVVVVTVAAGCPTVTVTAQTLPTGTLSALYPNVTFHASGGTAPYSWTVASGALPTGMTFSSAGVLSGTPAQSGSFPFSVIATDTNHCPSTPSSVALKVCGTIAISPSTLAAAVNVPFSAVLSHTGGTTPVSWSATGLPPGLTLSTTGDLSGTPTAAGSYNVNVTATDANSCAGSGVVVVTVAAACPTVTVTAPTLPTGTLSALYPNVTFHASGGTAPYTWAVSSGALPTGMTLSSGGVLSGTPAQSGSFTFSVIATDTNHCPSTPSSVTLKVCGTIAIAPSTLAAAVNVPFSAVLSHTGGAAPVSWSATGLPPGLTLSTTGDLSGTPTAAGSYNMSVTATDANTCTGSGVVVVTVAAGCPTVTVTALTLPTGTLNALYPNVTFHASGGTAPYTWAVASGALPAGMTLSTGGVLSGTPAQSGSFTFSVQATDTNHCPGTPSSVTLTVSKSCSAIAISPASLSGALGVSFSAALSQTGGVAPVSWSATGLPPGLTLSTTGILSGTPTSAGTYNASVTVTDANACTGSGVVEVTIAASCPATITVTAATLPAATVHTAYPSVTLHASGGTAPYSWIVASGALPNGMTLSSAGVLSGTPTQNGAFIFSVVAADTNHCPSASLSFTLRVCSTIAISPSTLTASLNTAFSAALSQTGGVAPVSWSATGLPAGLTLSTTGALSGTPTAAGIHNASVTVTDANGCTDSGVVAINVVSCPTVTVTSPINLPAATQGVLYPNVTLHATGGVASYTWSLVLGTLPTGMTLSSAGVLSGTPGQNGSFTFSVQATDHNGCSSTAQSATLTVSKACGAIAIAPSTLTASLSVAFSAALSQTGGVAPVSWSATGLPPGLTLSTTGALSGTPSVAGSYNASVTVTDANGCTGSGVVTIHVVSCPSVTGPTTLPTGTQGVLYPNVTFQATGGVLPYTWNVASGALPTGMSVSTAGVLSGTPAQNGTFPFSVHAADHNGCISGTHNVSLTVDKACTTITVTAATHTIPINTFFSTALTHTGGVAPVTWTATGVPTGMSLSTTGALSGTPTIAGSYNISATVTDANACTGSGVITVHVVSCPTLTITSLALPAATHNVAYPNVTLQANGGVAPYTWSMALGALPPGLSLSGAGVISGTPSQRGSFTFTVEAKDSKGCSATRQLSINVCNTITITPATLTAQRNVAFSAALSQTGGVPPLSWSALTGTTPAGLTLSADGILFGTPTTVGVTNLQVTVTDGDSCTGKADIKVTVVTCPTITIVGPTTLPIATQGEVYPTVTFQSTGGVEPITWSVVIGTLPTGMTLSPTGHLTGTPLQSGSFTFRVGATDANGCLGEDTTDLRLTVNPKCGTMTISPTTLPDAEIARTYAAVFSQSGGTLPVTWAHGTLPAGLTLSSSGLLSGVPTQSGTFDVGVTVTDHDNCVQNGVARLIVNCPTIKIVDVAIPPPQTTVAMSYQFDATGGTPNTSGGYSWAEVGGTKPPGLNLSSSGLLSGTPTTAGMYTFFVQATDTKGCRSSQKSVTVTVHLNCTSLGISGTPSSGTAGTAYSASPFTASGTTSGTTITWGATNLPAGMTINSSTGALSGTPTQTGTFALHVTLLEVKTTAPTATCAASSTVNLTINCPTITVAANAALTSADLDWGDNVTGAGMGFTASGGQGTYTYTATGLPPTMYLQSNGMLAGIAEWGTWTVGVTVTDSNGCTGSTSYSLEVDLIF